MRQIALGVACFSIAVIMLVRGAAQEASSRPEISEAKNIKLQWEPSDDVDVYLLESKLADAATWDVRSVRGTEIVIPAPSTQTEYRIRSIHPDYPEVTSLPSGSVFYPASNGDPAEPNIVRTIGLDAQGGVWELVDGSWTKLL